MGKAGKMKKKGQTGEVAQYITRNRAVRSLQLTLADFRKLCILKGIYPREPKHRQKVQKGSTQVKTLYYKKDIAFLSHDPVIWKIREQKIHMRKLRKAFGKNDRETINRIKNQKPTYKVDHMVRERYPTFNDALRDLDDALSMCFLFATMAKTSRVQHEMIYLCKRLTIEFMHYIIEAKALRRAFISIKGYYYQVEIMGEKITWIVPHNFTPVPPTEVDLRVMVVFCEFYLTLLGFVNYKLFQSLNLYYPPRLASAAPDEVPEVYDMNIGNERIEALNQPLKKSFVEKEDENETMIDEKLLDSTSLAAAKKEEQDLKDFKSLFNGLKFYTGRETNRESLTFVIRAFGGEVSWDETFFPGGTYSEGDQSITHQVMDRPSVEKKHLSRYYIQPQWIYDSINGRMLMPIQEYFTGVELPPHLSPFVELSDHAYVPPEKERLMAMQRGEKVPPLKQAEAEEEAEADNEDDGEIENEDDGEVENEGEGEEDNEDDSEDDEEMEIEGESDDEDEEEEHTTEDKKSSAIENMGVSRGKAVKVNEAHLLEKEDKYDIKMRAFMVPRKFRRLYRKLNKKKGKQDKRKRFLAEKRQIFEDGNKNTKAENKT